MLWLEGHSEDVMQTDYTLQTVVSPFSLFPQVRCQLGSFISSLGIPWAQGKAMPQVPQQFVGLQGLNSEKFLQYGRKLLLQ
jgi:hypothetical protein